MLTGCGTPAWIAREHSQQKGHEILVECHQGGCRGWTLVRNSLLKLFTCSQLRLVGKYILGHPKAMRRPHDRAKILLGNRCATCSARLAAAAHQAQIPWALENPGGSRLWHHPDIAALSHLAAVHRRVGHMCGYGTNYKKPTAVLCGLCKVPGLERVCPGCQEHVILQGSNRTALAQVYPWSYAKEAANMLLQSQTCV